ncbi:hypothetical protein BGZ65_011765, partial [Modicella reniformis]
MADPKTLREKMPYPGSTVLRSTASQLSIELRKHYRNGSRELCEKIQALKNKGLLPADTPSSINSNISAIENFVILNKACNYRRKLVPLSSFENAF